MPQDDLPNPSNAPLFATQRNPRLRLIIPAVVAIAFLMEQLDSTIITTAIPDMARSLGTTALRMNLAVTTYVLTLAVFIPVSGWFADRFGARRIFVLALIVFTTGSVLCGMANSFAMLIFTRGLQGLGGAMMTPVGRLILLRSFPRDQLFTGDDLYERARARRPGHRPSARRLHHHLCLVALDLLHQHSLRLPRHPAGLALRRGDPRHQPAAIRFSRLPDGRRRAGLAAIRDREYGPADHLRRSRSSPS